MPTIGASGTQAEPGCSGQAVLSGRTTQVLARPAVERQKAITIVAGQLATIKWQMVDQDRLPLSIATCFSSGSSSIGADQEGAALALAGFVVSIAPDTPTTDIGSAYIKFVVTEAVAGINLATYDVTIEDADTGIVSVRLDPTINIAGVYNAEFAVFDGNDNLIFVNRVYLMVEPRVGDQFGMPTRAELRLRIRSSSPAEFLLIAGVEFDDAEIASALINAVYIYNESLPQVHPVSTQTFRHRAGWIQGTTALLYEMLAQYYRANQLAYTTGNAASIDDMNKAQYYEAKAADLMQKYKAWVQSTKVSINVNDCFAIIGSEW